MRRHFRRLLVVSIGFWAVVGPNASAKPPGLPTAPDTEFKVLSPLAQEQFEPDDANPPSVYIPLASASAAPATAAAIGSAWTQIVWQVAEPKRVVWSFRIELKTPTDWLASFGRGWIRRSETAGIAGNGQLKGALLGGVGVAGGLVGEAVVMDQQATKKERLLRDVYEMAEDLRKAGDWDAAKTWYAGVAQLDPCSAYAKLAEQRLDRLMLARIAAEAGEEQSEEPPIAGPERLTVQPREVAP